MGNETEGSLDNGDKKPTPNWSDVTQLLDEEVAVLSRRRSAAAPRDDDVPPVAAGAEPSGAGREAGKHADADGTAEVADGDVHDRTATHGAGDKEHASTDPGPATTQSAHPQPTIGLALSGGGVRSATFCLGLLRGMAQNGLLPRFDYLSTVSGGGYAGAVLGRLISAVGIDKAQSLLASSDSLVLGWLRRHGRYLTPQGARDLGVAIASYGRGALAVHLELGVLAMLVGLLVIAPHILQVSFEWLNTLDWSPWRTVWWPPAVFLWLLLAPGTLTTYWMLRDRPPRERAKKTSILSAPNIFAILLLCGFTAWVVVSRISDLAIPIGAPGAPTFVMWVLTGLCLHYLLLIIVVVTLPRWQVEGFGARYRNHLTAALRFFNLAAVILVLVGLVDILSWELTNLLADEEPLLLGGIGAGAVLLIVVRTFSEHLQRLTTSRDGAGFRFFPGMLNLIGLGAGFCLLLLWVTVMQWLVFGGESGRTPLADLPHWLRASLIAVPILFWLLGTGRNRDTANTSSLHNFYRGRLTRAYLATGNRGRFGPDLGGIHAGEDVDERYDVTELEDGDDVPLENYRPEESGGPIHLICACFNQTRADRSGLYNADRRGLPLTASARGITVGTDKLRSPDDVNDLGTLGRWIAISGAAASPGAGSYTTTGWALLLFMAGARLGYWFDARRPKGKRSSLRDWFGNSKPGRLASEALARFRGTTRPAWYLSDGGHFDNTGVHALIQRKLDFILLADCGGDPRFEFGDIENLVRKARIDFNAEIDFYTHKEASQLFCLPGSELAVISPEQMVDNTSLRGVILARIRYSPDSPGGASKIGTLLVVKPNLHQALDSDLLAYARRNPQFPQQSISDQFFDEAQWESYHRLGEDFGRALSPHWLSQLPGWAAPAPSLTHVPALRRPALRQAEVADASIKPFWRADVKSAAIGTTIGLGALGSLAYPLWQVYERVATKRNETNVEVAELLRSGNLPNWIVDGRSMASSSEDASVDATAAAPVTQPREAAADYPRNETELVAESNKLNAGHRMAIKQMYALSRDAARQGGPAEAIREVVMSLQQDCGFQKDLPKPACEDTTSTASICASLCTRTKATDPYWTIKPVCVASDGDIAKWIGRLNGAWADELTCSVATISSTAASTPYSDTPLEIRPLPWPDNPWFQATRVPPLWSGSSEDEDPSIIASANQIPPVRGEDVERHDPTSASDFSVCSNGSGKPMTLYVQVYDEQTRARWMDIPWSIPARIRVPGIENVMQTAAAQGRRPPTPWRQPTMLVHRRDNGRDLKCAQDIASALATIAPELIGAVDIRGLPASFSSDRHVIELWIPPAPKSYGSE